MKTNKTFYGIFLISLAALSLEISLIRFFSISQWYHFAFMVVSIALFGIAASGTFLTIKKLHNPLFISSILFSLSVLIGFFITNNLIFDPFKAVLDFKHIFILLIYYIFLGMPFFFFGIIIAHSFSKFQKKAGKIYFYNMSGSAIGTLASLLFISYLDINTIFAISLIGLISALFFVDKKKKKIIFLFFLILINLLLLLFVPLTINISEYKELSQALKVPGSTLLNTQYNSFSRVDTIESSFIRYAPGLSPVFDKNLPEQIGITIDAGNMNAITKYENLDFINYLPSALPYFLTENRKTLIINAGAGLDVLVALENNAAVTALETNPIVIDLLKNEYSDYSGNIYHNADIIFGQGRSFIKHNKEKFDIIIVSLAGNVLSTGGISGLSENYLLTKQAFEDYYNNLSDNGLLLITQWLVFPPRNSLRLLSLSLEIDKDAKKTALFRTWTTVTLLLSKKDLGQKTMENIKDFTQKNKFDLIYLPTNFVPNKYLKFEQPFYYNSVKNLLENKHKFYKNYIFNVRAVTDDKPFYSNFFKLSKINELKKIAYTWNPFFDSGFLLFFILAQAFIGILLFILLPIKLFHRTRKKLKNKALFYFFAIGISYMFIEIVLIQKFVLFLGHIVFSSSSIIFSTLLFSSLGALYSEKVGIKKINKIIFILFILIIFYVFLLNFVMDVFISLNVILKIILTIVFIAPLGFFMGFPFPLGIKAIKKELIPLAWAVNGSASVLSPILAIMLALFFGYNFVFVLAGTIYVISALFIKNFH